MEMKGSNYSVINLISVVIPCYNYGHFLPIAIDSIINQTYLNKEIIVVDDGSSDNTAEVAASYEEVKYIYQKNRGLSAARNFGAAHSNGELLVFLDADDWLYPKALEISASYFCKNPSLKLVSGAYNLIFVKENKTVTRINRVDKNHYTQLLMNNYMAVPGSVMIKKEVFDIFKFDPNLKACEDYDLYLKIARDYPVFCHTYIIAAYVTHSNNMSGNIPLMLSSSLNVLERQKKRLRTSSERKAYAKGKRFWIDYYCSQLFLNLIMNKVIYSKKIMLLLLYYKPIFFIKFLVHKTGIIDFYTNRIAILRHRKKSTDERVS